MSTSQTIDEGTETGRQSRVDDSLASQLYRLTEATLRVGKTLEGEDVLQEVADGARYVAQARYGVVVLFDESNGFQQMATSGAEPHQFDQVPGLPVGKGLLGYLNELDHPLRVADITDHPMSIGLPDGHPPMTSFLGVHLWYEDQHLGNIYLTDKLGDPGFTELDEEMAVRFAEHAGVAIVNSRRFERERRIKTDLKALVKIAPVGLVVFDARTGAILSANQECRRIAGESGGEATTWDDVLDKVVMRRADGREIPPGVRPSMQAMQSGEVVRAEEMLLCFKDGRNINALVNAAPIYSDRGEIVSAVVSVQDLTVLEDAQRMRAEFLGMVSQELRTPLMTIKGSIVALTDLVGSTNETESLHLLGMIDHQAEMMREQINSLIELSHISSGALPLSLETANVKTLVDEAVREFKRNHGGITVKQGVAQNLPDVLVDKDRMTLMLRNLLAHAFKFSSEDSAISVNYEPRDFQMAVNLTIRSGRTPAAQLPELVQKIQASRDEDTRQAIDRDGLAFTICKGIVEAHGGQLRVERGSGGHGMEFTFTIPISGSEVDDQSLDFGPAWDIAYPSNEMTGRILVLGGDESTVATICGTLSGEGYDPLVVLGFDNLESLIETQHAQAVLLDLSASGSEGFETLGRITTSYRVPVIAVVDQGDGERAARATGMGAEWCLVKPVSPAELLARIRTPLKRAPKSESDAWVADYTVGPVAINYDSHRVTVAGEVLQLTATEYKLLYELSHNSGRVMTQDELLRKVWGSGYSGESQLLRAYVKTLRHKLGDNARRPSYIYTEHGVGYRMPKP